MSLVLSSSRETKHRPKSEAQSLCKKAISSGEGTGLSAMEVVQQRPGEDAAEGNSASRGMLYPTTLSAPSQPLEPYGSNRKRIMSENIPASILPSTTV